MSHNCRREVNVQNCLVRLMYAVRRRALALTGARIMRAVFKKYAAQLHLRLSWPGQRQVGGSALAEQLEDVGQHASSLSFFENLVSCLEVRACIY